MSDKPDVPGHKPPSRLHKLRWTTWIEIAVAGAAYLLAARYRPFAHLFDFTAFEERHGDWPEMPLMLAVLIAAKSLYLRFFRHETLSAELEATKRHVAQGRVKRPPLSVRSVFLLCTLALVSLGWYAPEPHGGRILAIAVPLFLLFAAIEFSAVVRPGDSVLPDPRDELLLFFRARMLKVGYITAILALISLYLVSLFANTCVGLLLPFVLTISLLTPAFLYSRLNRQAGPDE
jgi:di/tricarboxylate transporter